MSQTIAFPNIPYQPRDPKSYKPNIAVIGTGGISGAHLTAYKKAKYNVVALCDLNESAARKRQAEFFPDARVYTDYRDVLKRDDVEVVDVTLHPQYRAPVLEAALNARKHVLSQKPFVLDLEFGRRLCDLAEKNDVKLAVNQNGRWSPHWSYIRESIAAGLIGNVKAVHLAAHWDHNWIASNAEFNKVRHIILYDYAIHYFDAIHTFTAGLKPATRVFASMTRTPTQRAAPPMLAQVLIEFDGAQASLIQDGDVPFGQSDLTFVAGTTGTIVSAGPSLNEQTVTVSSDGGSFSPRLMGAWFPDGFHGSMGELLCAIEEKREPGNSGRDNLQSLALCYAACASADIGEPKRPGEVRTIKTD